MILWDAVLTCFWLVVILAIIVGIGWLMLLWIWTTFVLVGVVILGVAICVLVAAIRNGGGWSA